MTGVRGLLRTGAGKAALAAGLGVAAGIFALAEFSPGTSMGVRLPMAVMLGGLAAYGTWCAADIPALLLALVRMIRGRPAGAEGKSPANPAGVKPAPTERPILAPARKRLVRRIAALMGEEGIFAPDLPDPAILYEGVADWGGPVTQASLLMALGEADYWHPGQSPERHMARLAVHDSHSEQFDETVREQIADLIRLAEGALVVQDIAIDLRLPEGRGLGRGREAHCMIAMTVNGAPLRLTYRPAAKYLSTHLHVALARALRDTGAERRLAWLWCDQGAWISCLTAGADQRLNSGPGHDRRGFGGWSWIDEASPVAAGDMPTLP
jgi:hypothetical protein